MDITLVTSSYDKVVHGTENDKKTGCGINLLRPENVTRFHRTSKMRDLKEITCEKCKASLAKKMIKADKKEMALLLKEEKKREKLGMGDEGIVPLGNTTARITRDPDAQRKEEEARRRAAEEARAARAAEEARRAQEAAQAPEPPVNTIPGTGIPMDAGLAQFAINAPTNDQPEPAPVQAAAPAPQDDFLAQFAINKPVDEAEAAPAAARPEDDFLAQFAIPVPQSAEAVPEPAVQPQTEEDIMQMFSINNAPAQEQPYGQPYGEPLYSQPPIYGDQQIIDVDGTELSPVAPVYDGVVPTADNGQELIQGSEWDFVANQLFGADGTVQPVPEPVMEADPAPVYPQYDENLPKEMDELDIPAIQDIAAPVLDEIPSVEDITAPVLDEIPSVEDITAPVLDEIPSVDDITAPVLDEIPSVEDITAPVLDEIPSVEDITAPVFDEIPSVDDITAPVLDEIPSVEDITAPVLDEIPSVEDITAPVFDEIPSVQDAAAPVIDEIPAFDDIAAPVSDDIAEPIFNEPLMAEEEFDSNMSDYNYVAPGRGAEANTENTEQPRQAAPQQPQIIKVPQLAGYDSNNQPVYKYVQMRLAGYDQKGQPVYVPMQAAPAQQAAKPQQAAAPVQQAAAPRPQVQPQQAAAPAQQTAAQAQRAAAAPVQPAVQAQPAAVNSPVPRKPVQQSGVPKANISQIAVNPHSKQTSQAFINAIASSKEYADKNLIDTQGLKANSPVLTSVEDVLSTMGDDSVKRQKAVQAQQAVPVFEEYKSPARNTYRGGGSSPKMHQPLEKDARYMTKSELKAKKKQDKIDAKFKKEMSKRGF
ncbi:MAG: hypothetical protein IKH96_02200 [Ruminococcus sp.]|uniref:hypothetical protein n=1 Tax=Ruminococcus sp. TaxID=41978 RepID=UPI0025FDC248|nr:hypothetical protein [Ruminococcus sp.]MBR6994810.1 hypothetical protein [Ruminococcus sp.]